jgi:hypothetical protein
LSLGFPSGEGSEGCVGGKRNSIVKFVVHRVPRKARKLGCVVITMMVVPSLKTVQADSANTYRGASVKSSGAERL